MENTGTLLMARRRPKPKALASISPSRARKRPVPSASEFINQIIDKRIQHIQDGFNTAFLARIIADREVQKQVGELYDHKLTTRIFQISRTRRKNALEGTALAIIRDQITPVIVRAIPSITRRGLIDLVKAGWPHAGGRRATRPFDPHLIKAAHDALIREDPQKRNCKVACGELAEKLAITFRTIKSYLARASGKN